MSQEAATTPTPAMDLQLSRVFGPEGTVSLQAVLRIARVILD